MITRRRRTTGAALIEFAAGVSLLLLLLLGIIEFGLLFKDLLILQEAARVGARSAGLGDTTTVITQRVRNSAVSLTASSLSTTLTYSTNNGSSFGETLSDSGGANTAPVGSLIKVRVSYPHAYLTGFVVPGQTSKTLVAEMVAHREYAGTASSGKGKGKVSPRLPIRPALPLR